MTLITRGLFWPRVVFILLTMLVEYVQEILINGALFPIIEVNIVTI